MAFTQGYNNNGSNNGEPKKKSNFKVSKIYGTDAQADISVWNSDKGGSYGIITIKAAVGKDPSTGGNVYVTKMASELPSIFMNAEKLRTCLEYLKTTPAEQLNGEVSTGRGTKIGFQGGSTSVKITVTSQKNGAGTITLDADNVGGKNIHSQLLNLIDALEICHKHAKLSKLDSEEFSKVLTGEGSNAGESDSDEAPF